MPHRPSASSTIKIPGSLPMQALEAKSQTQISTECPLLKAVTLNQIIVAGTTMYQSIKVIPHGALKH